MMCIGTTMRMGDRMNWKLGNEQAMLLLNWKCGASPKKLQIFVVHRDNTDRERFRQWQQAREAKNPNSEINKHDHSFRSILLLACLRIHPIQTVFAKGMFDWWCHEICFNRIWY